MHVVYSCHLQQSVLRTRALCAPSTVTGRDHVIANHIDHVTRMPAFLHLKALKGPGDGGGNGLMKTLNTTCGDIRQTCGLLYRKPQIGEKLSKKIDMHDFCNAAQ